MTDHPRTGPLGPGSRALLIGTQRYERLADVEPAWHNVAGLRAALTDPGIGGLDPAACRSVAASVDAYLLGSTTLPAPVRPTDRPLIA
ncbi:hypothetical protein ACFWZ2_35975 [Streptomyces sp. NPDC059002]|uniref:hypothetical protein n=1 Tax=Streptomyces sp. NPDC059002 TaxID=3346690 RepID=UPI00368F0793